MTKYFKGNIINVNQLPDYNYSLNIIKTYFNCRKNCYLLDNTTHQLLLYFRKYSGSELGKLVNLLKDIIAFNNDESEKQQLDKKIVDLINETPNNVSGYPIIYEKIYDEDGNIYGKELLSGAIFPINYKFSSFDVDYSIKPFERKIYYEVENEKGYTLDGDIYHIIDLEGRARGISKNDYNHLKNMCTFSKETIYFDNKLHELIVSEELYYFDICLKPKITFHNNIRVDYALSGEKIASELEVNNYLNKFAYGFRKKRNRQEYEKKINYYALSNYLGEVNFVFGDVIKERVSESVITKEMQQLEFLLFRLKSVSQEDYEILHKEYFEILNQNDDELHLNNLSLNSIISLQNRAELAFICHGGNCKRIIAYLESWINIYLGNYNAGSVSKTAITIKDLDKLCSYFLNSKNSYTIKEQNDILRCLSLLYFFEIYENRNILISDDIKNSYIADNIKRILVVIGVLHDVGIIKNIPNSFYDISDFDEFLCFIKEIEISGIVEENGKELIKKIQQ